MKRKFKVTYTLKNNPLDFKNKIVTAYNLVEVIKKIEESLNHNEDIQYIVVEEA